MMASASFLSLARSPAISSAMIALFGCAGLGGEELATKVTITGGAAGTAGASGWAKTSLSLFSVSDDVEGKIGDFARATGQVRLLCPVSLQMLHFLDIVDGNWRKCCFLVAKKGLKNGRWCELVTKKHCANTKQARGIEEARVHKSSCHLPKGYPTGGRVCPRHHRRVCSRGLEVEAYEGAWPFPAESRHVVVSS